VAVTLVAAQVMAGRFDGYYANQTTKAGVVG